MARQQSHYYKIERKTYKDSQLELRIVVVLGVFLSGGLALPHLDTVGGALLIPVDDVILHNRKEEKSLS